MRKVEGTMLMPRIVYTPPHAATRGCNVFDEDNGEARHVEQCVYDSVGGKLVT
jgi:hypothetical protein